ncbi:MAG: hypothetical protein ACYC10_20245 [Allorhizobium sp.]
MAPYDPLKVLETARFFKMLSRNYESAVGDFFSEWSCGRELTKDEAEWLSTLHDYAKTLEWYAQRAEGIVHGEQFPL